MKKYTLLILMFCSYFCVFAEDEQSCNDDTIVDASLFKSALDYFDQHGYDGAVPFDYDALNIPHDVSYQNDTYNNGGVCYQRIGRFSDEDYFDAECVNNILAAAPAAIKQIIINLLYPPKNKAALPKRLLLVGKPGTGKTALAKAIAIKCGYDYYMIEAPFLLNEYKNSGPQNLLREIYPVLASGRKVVVILDELTELTDRYKKENDSDATVAAALWILLDSCAQCDNVFFIGTSNKQKKDLPAQLQSRFDEDIITINMPDTAARKRMLQHFLKHERHKIDAAFLQYLVKKTNGRSAREIEKLVCKAIQCANVRIPRRYTVTCKDFEKALALWKPFYHPVVIYEKIEPHLQPFFKTAFPIILQTIGLIHSIYVSSWQKKNSDESLALQKLSYLLQKIGLGYQKDGLDCQRDAFEFQKQAHGQSHAVQKESLGVARYSAYLQSSKGGGGGIDWTNVDS
jgi:ATPase family associated with various cellular activities (AAA)